MRWVLFTSKICLMQGKCQQSDGAMAVLTGEKEAFAQHQ